MSNETELIQIKFNDDVNTSGTAGTYTVQFFKVALNAYVLLNKAAL